MRKGDEQDGWIGYITDGMEKEPKSVGEMLGQAFTAMFRTLIFMFWLMWKAFKFIFKIIKELIEMFGRKKKQEIDPRQFGGYPQQPYPQQPYPQQPYPQYPQQPIPQPPQSPYQQPAQSDPVLAMIGALNAKVAQMERDIEELFSRMNMMQGVQPAPTKRVQFKKH